MHSEIDVFVAISAGIQSINGMHSVEFCLRVDQSR